MPALSTSGNVKVCIRIRPESTQELTQRSSGKASSSVLVNADSKSNSDGRSSSSTSTSGGGGSPSEIVHYSGGVSGLPSSSNAPRVQAGSGGSVNQPSEELSFSSNKIDGNGVIPPSSTSMSSSMYSSGAGGVGGVGGQQQKLSGSGPKKFTFDSIFSSHVAQDEVFESIGRPVVDRVLEGFNGTILAYGQTGSGKTFTMMGPDGGRAENLCGDLRGVVPRCLEVLLGRLRKLGDSGEISWSVSLSAFELYNEELQDLFPGHQVSHSEGEGGGGGPSSSSNVDTSTSTTQAADVMNGSLANGTTTSSSKVINAPPQRAELKIREDRSLGGRGVFVDGLTSVKVKSVEDAVAAIQRASTRKHIAGTNANGTSSRAHTIVQLFVEQVSFVENGTKTTAQLSLVDLAGSERLSKTGATGQRLKEAQHINLSLTLLGNVIMKLTDGKSLHVPYRDAKLTRLLQDALGGNALTTLLCAISPSSFQSDETLSTLRFANRAKEIQNKPTANKEMTESELRVAFAAALEEIKILRDRVKALEGILKLQSPTDDQSNPSGVGGVGASGGGKDGHSGMTPRSITQSSLNTPSSSLSSTPSRRNITAGGGVGSSPFRGNGAGSGAALARRLSATTQDSDYLEDGATATVPPKAVGLIVPGGNSEKERRLEETVEGLLRDVQSLKEDLVERDGSEARLMKRLQFHEEKERQADAKMKEWKSKYEREKLACDSWARKCQDIFAGKRSDKTSTSDSAAVAATPTRAPKPPGGKLSDSPSVRGRRTGSVTTTTTTSSTPSRARGASVNNRRTGTAPLGSGRSSSIQQRNGGSNGDRMNRTIGRTSSSTAAGRGGGRAGRSGSTVVVDDDHPTPPASIDGSDAGGGSDVDVPKEEMSEEAWVTEAKDANKREANALIRERLLLSQVDDLKAQVDSGKKYPIVIERLTKDLEIAKEDFNRKMAAQQSQHERVLSRQDLEIASLSEKLDVFTSKEFSTNGTQIDASELTPLDHSDNDSPPSKAKRIESPAPDKKEGSLPKSPSPSPQQSKERQRGAIHGSDPQAMEEEIQSLRGEIQYLQETNGTLLSENRTNGARLVDFAKRIEKHAEDLMEARREKERLRREVEESSISEELKRRILGQRITDERSKFRRKLLDCFAVDPSS